MKVLPIFIIISCCTLLFSFNAQAEKQVITVWNYYLAPPFKISKTEGLATDFVALLNKELGNILEFKLVSLPRARLNKYLSKKRQGIVLFVNWAWMGKDSKTKYLWTPTLLKDKNEIISSINKKVFYKNPESLIGLKFGAVRGRKYKGLQELMLSGDIKRLDLNEEKQVIKMIVDQRVDVTSQPHSIAMFLINSLKMKKKIFFSPTPLFEFNRYIMITPKLMDVHTQLSELVKNLDNNKDWGVILAKYNLREE